VTPEIHSPSQAETTVASMIKSAAAKDRKRKAIDNMFLEKAGFQSARRVKLNGCLEKANGHESQN